eukprot:7773456-Pyramimonas_sp.AAC.2
MAAPERRAEPVSGPPYGRYDHSGPFLDPFSTVLDPFWTLFQPFWTLIGPFLDPFGPFVDPFWTVLDPYSTVLDPFWTVLDPFWTGLLGPFGTDLDRFEPYLDPFGTVLDRPYIAGAVSASVQSTQLQPINASVSPAADQLQSTRRVLWTTGGAVGTTAGE